MKLKLYLFSLLLFILWFLVSIWLRLTSETFVGAATWFMTVLTWWSSWQMLGFYKFDCVILQVIFNLYGLHRAADHCSLYCVSRCLQRGLYGRGLPTQWFIILSTKQHNSCPNGLLLVFVAICIFINFALISLRNMSSGLITAFPGMNCMNMQM